MIECPIYFLNPADLLGDTSDPPDESTACRQCCNCGYLQYESLLPYLKEIRSSLKDTPEQSSEFEFRLREQIVEISRLFDIDAGVDPGFFSKAHYITTTTHQTNGTQFIKIPDFVKGTLEIRTLSNVLLEPSSYGFQDGFLVYLPCVAHASCGCTMGCTKRKSRQPVKWPNTCYKITARWGRDCADMAVQMAIRDYLIESYRFKDPVTVMATGLQAFRNFQVPHSWNTYIRNFKAERALYSQFAFA